MLNYAKCNRDLEALTPILPLLFQPILNVNETLLFLCIGQRQRYQSYSTI